MITNAFIEQHIHGAYGVDFLNCSVDELLYCAKQLKSDGVALFLPTLATAPIEVLKKQIATIKKTMNAQAGGAGGCSGGAGGAGGARIFGVNLEACFISPLKKGIHDEKQLLEPTVENFKLLEDEVIKIVTLAPELDKNYELTKYLKSKNIKAFAGHTTAFDLTEVNGVTHIFNAMAGIEHRKKNTVTSALLNDDLYCEIIADGYHIDYDNVKLVLKTKPKDKIILISDALPIASSDRTEMEFCSKKIYLKDGKATDEKGTLAGSSMLLPQIVKKLVRENILTLEAAAEMASNSAKLFNIDFQDKIVWDEKLNIIEV